MTILKDLTDKYNISDAHFNTIKNFPDAKLCLKEAKPICCQYKDKNNITHYVDFDATTTDEIMTALNLLSTIYTKDAYSPYIQNKILEVFKNLSSKLTKKEETEDAVRYTI